jgi:DNA-binding CsgD family transcriptional regulator
VSCRLPPWQNHRVAKARTLHQALTELRAMGSARLRRSPRTPEVVPLLMRLLTTCKTLGFEERAGGLALRLQGATEKTEFSLTCLLGHPGASTHLTTAERSVAEQLCEGRTIAQIASHRGVSANTVKSQVRQIFRKLNVESRVALVRMLCP